MRVPDRSLIPDERLAQNAGEAARDRPAGRAPGSEWVAAAAVAGVVERTVVAQAQRPRAATVAGDQRRAAAQLALGHPLGDVARHVARARGRDALLERADRADRAARPQVAVDVGRRRLAAPRIAGVVLPAAGQLPLAPVAQALALRGARRGRGRLGDTHARHAVGPGGLVDVDAE